MRIDAPQSPGQPDGPQRHRTIQDALHRYGFVGLLREALTRIRRKLFDQRSVILFHATPSGVQSRSFPPDYAIRTLPRAEVAGMRSTPFFGILYSALQDGPSTQELHAAIHEGQVVAWGISFVGAKDWPIPEVAAKLSLDPEDAVLTSFFTLPEFRGRRLYQGLMVIMAKHVASKGARSIQIWCDEKNLASRSAIERVGFRPIATLRCMVILGRCFRLATRVLTKASTT